MENLKIKKVGSLVAEDYRFADVFKKYDIDFCCNGGVTIEEACKTNNVDQTELINDLKSINRKTYSGDYYQRWNLDTLIDHIISVHHTFVAENLPLLKAYATKVAEVHGSRHPETEVISRLIDDLSNELFPHMNKEENVLFPYIKDLLKQKEGDSGGFRVGFDSVKSPIAVMMSEHEAAGAIMKSISSLSSGFNAPDDACTTYKVLYQKLRDFEEDLHQHIHLENNILFPKAIKMEADFKA
jgi:regulator of cell morphogenesis and NO signaling